MPDTVARRGRGTFLRRREPMSRCRRPSPGHRSRGPPPVPLALTERGAALGGGLSFVQLDRTRTDPGPKAYQMRIPAKIKISNPSRPIRTRSTIATRISKTAIPRLIVWTMFVHGRVHSPREEEPSLNWIQAATYPANELLSPPVKADRAPRIEPPGGRRGFGQVMKGQPGLSRLDSQGLADQVGRHRRRHPLSEGPIRPGTRAGRGRRPQPPRGPSIPSSANLTLPRRPARRGAGSPAETGCTRRAADTGSTGAGTGEMACWVSRGNCLPAGAMSSTTTLVAGTMTVAPSVTPCVLALVTVSVP